MPLDLTTVNYVPIYKDEVTIGLLGREMGVESYNSQGDLSLVIVNSY